MKLKTISIVMILLILSSVINVSAADKVFENLTEWTPKFYNKNGLEGESSQDGEKRIFKLVKGESYDGSDAMYIRYESAEPLVDTWGGYTNNGVSAQLNDMISKTWSWETNTEYQISFVFKTAKIEGATHQPFIKVFFGDWVQNKTNDLSKISTEGLTEKQISDGWKRYSTKYTTTATVSNMDIINVQMPGEYWIDDISLKKTGGAELIPNGSFKPYDEPDYYLDTEGIDGWIVYYGLKGADGNLESDNGSTRAVRVANGISAKGHRSLRIRYWSDSTPISWDGGKTYDVYQGGVTVRNTNFVPEAGKEYTLSYLMKNEGTAKLLFWIGGVKILSSAVTPSTEGLSADLIKQGWKRYSHTFTTINTDYFSISANYINTWYLDNISVTAGADPTKTNLLSAVSSDFEEANDKGYYAQKAYFCDEYGNDIIALTADNSEKTITVKSTVTNYSVNEGLSAQLIACLYRDDTLIGLSMSDKKSLNIGESELITAKLELPKIEEENTYTVKAFIRDAEDIMNPLGKKSGTIKDVSFGNTVILGDSYSTYEGYIPEGNSSWYKAGGSKQTDVTDASHTWWHQLMSASGSNLLLNDSWSGTTICNTGYNGEDVSDKSFVARADALIEKGFFKENDVDTIFVFGGTNDTWANSPVGELKYSNWTEEDLYSSLPAFCYLIDILKKAEPDAKIICVLGTMLSKEIKQGYNDACMHYGVIPVRLNITDVYNSHPTIRGMTQIKNQILDGVLNP